MTMQGKNAAGLVTAGSCQVHETSPWWTCLISRAVPLTLPPLRRKELEGQAVVIMSGADTADSRPGEGKNAGGQAAVGVWGPMAMELLDQPCSARDIASSERKEWAGDGLSTRPVVVDLLEKLPGERHWG